jgi:hypothetical protein
LATQVRIAPVPYGHGLSELFLEPVKRVTDDLRMQHSLQLTLLRSGAQAPHASLQSREELALEIQSANQQTIRANLVAPLRMHVLRRGPSNKKHPTTTVRCRWVHQQGLLRRREKDPMLTFSI